MNFYFAANFHACLLGIVWDDARVTFCFGPFALIFERMKKN